jgi:excinuclease ABC subunit C
MNDHTTTALEGALSHPPVANADQQLEADNALLVPNATLAEKLHTLPKNPGVYLHKNAEGTIIYVGKAKNLRNRVRSYFQNRPMDAKTTALVRKIADLEFIITDSEVEALILENTLIKQHKPKYNILLKDDKSYPYICVTNEPFPRIFHTRKIIRDGSKYFGPYTEGKYLYAMLETLHSIFPIRSCKLDLTDDGIAKKKFKVCLDYQIKKCEGPCEGLVSRLHYATMIQQAVQILKGKTRGVEKEIMQAMERAAEELRFEEAAALRNRLNALREYSERQKVVTTELIDRDVMATARSLRYEQDACAVIFKVRDGKLVGRQHFYIAGADGKSDADLLRATFERFYIESDDVPDEIFLPIEIEERETLEAWLRTKRGGKVEISVPQIGDKRKLVNMAAANADFLVKELELQRLKKEEDKGSILPRSVLALQRDLRLPAPPRRIDCFDNSHFQGSETVSSMVVFVDGKPKKSEYRKYKIRTVEGIDDFKSMQEVVGRRYKRMLEEQSQRPDLIIIDGGKGQLSHAVEILRGLGLHDGPFGKKAEHGHIPTIGLAKRLEEVFFPEQSDSILLPKTSSSLKLIQQARDEAHRFAIEFHRSLRDKRTLQTELTEIDGVGEKTAQKLLVELGSVEGVRSASKEDLVRVAGAKAAERIMAYFHGQDLVEGGDIADEFEKINEDQDNTTDAPEELNEGIPS